MHGAASIICTLLLLLATGCTADTGNSTSMVERLRKIDTSLNDMWSAGSFRGFMEVVRSEEVAFAILESVTEAVDDSLMTASALAMAKSPSVGAALGILGIIFSIVSSIASVINIVVFTNEADSMMPVIKYLEVEFNEVNSKLDRNFREIEDLKSIVKCNEAYRQLKDRRLKVNAFFERYRYMVGNATINSTLALSVFDKELEEYPHSTMLLETHNILTDIQFHSNMMRHCARGNLLQYMRMTVENFQTLQKAIVLDITAKTRLQSLSRDAITWLRNDWQKKLGAAVQLMESEARDLVLSGWYAYFKEDLSRTMEVTAVQSGHNAAGSISGHLQSKFEYIRAAVILLPPAAESSHEILDASKKPVSEMRSDNFLCYSAVRRNRERVIVLCRNWLDSQKEQLELDAKFKQHSVGITSLSLLQALRNSKLEEIDRVMERAKGSFFALHVQASVYSKDVTVVQHDSRGNLVFHTSGNELFHLRVITKFVELQQHVPVESPVMAAAADAGSWLLLLLCCAIAQLPLVQMTAT